MILLVSCAHGLVHVFEVALPSVEQMIDDEFHIGRDGTGMLGTAWRLPFGVMALLAGWLADRYGSKPLLLVYLCGCAVTSFVVWWTLSLSMLFVVMFAMGCFASIYHPAGLSLISKETTAENRGAALGWHGVFGSLGIAAAPFLAGLAFSSGQITWRGYYLLLTVPAGVLVVLIAVFLPRGRHSPGGPRSQSPPEPKDANEARWGAFFLVVTVGAMSGLIYSAFIHFLPRYLDQDGMRPSDMTPESFRNLLAAVVLLCGVAGQAVGGKLARPGRLELWFPAILLANVPLLVWMAVAEGQTRLWASCSLALVHFMNQPLYNSLIAQYVPQVKRSVAYGFSFLMCFGLGSLGPTVAGFIGSLKGDQWTYGSLAVIAAAGGLLATGLSSKKGQGKRKKSG